MDDFSKTVTNLQVIKNPTESEKKPEKINMSTEALPSYKLLKSKQVFNKISKMDDGQVQKELNKSRNVYSYRRQMIKTTTQPTVRQEEDSPDFYKTAFHMKQNPS